MPRLSREDQKIQGKPCHIINRGNNSMAVFKDAEDRNKFMAIVTKVLREYGFLLYHYAVMITHFHLDICDNGCEISDAMKKIEHRYSLHFKEKYDWNGKVWGGRFKSHVEYGDSYKLTAGIYILLNPERSNLVQNSIDWKWCSASHYIGGEGKYDRRLTYDPAYLKLGRTHKERRQKYMELVDYWRAHPPSKSVAKQFFKVGAPKTHPDFMTDQDWGKT